MENQLDEIKIVKPEYQWYVIYTAPRSEKKVYDRLLDELIESYMPTYVTERQWSDRRKMVEVPLFNSYIFVRLKETELSSVLRVAGVVRFVYYLKQPAIVRQREIDNIREFLRQTQGYRIKVQKGDKVQVSSGMLNGVSGEVIRVNKNKVMIRIEQIGLSVVATVPRSQLQKPLLQV
ncbi:MAG: UpxY family transcription antiterminator [Bacteroidales bacterium]|nr:UpxY family transcription antiterminator [Bacteroidales bacterium]